MKTNIKKITVRKPFRSLLNYKTMHGELARSKGVYEQFMDAKSLTVARKILFG